MNRLAKREDQRLSKFDPVEAKDRQAKADAVIQYATKIKNWPMLEDAIDLKIAEQEEFVRWWREVVGAGHGGDRIKNAERHTWSVEKAEELTQIKQPQVSRWGKRLQDPPAYRGALIAAAFKKAMLSIPDGASSSTSDAADYDSDEWYTPSLYIEAAREVMGGIDLDPASCAHAQRRIDAARFYTKRDDGLAKEWKGRVWLNPPYSQPAATQFADKLLEEYRAGRVTQAVMVQNSGTDTAWFHRMAAAAWMCLVRGRINFDQAKGGSAANRYAQVFFYLGDGQARFVERFCVFGLVGKLEGAVR